MIPKQERIPSFSHPMDCSWKESEDFYFRKFLIHLSSREKKNYLSTPVKERWRLYHKKILFYQELEALLAFFKVSISSIQLKEYYESNSIKEAKVFLSKINQQQINQGVQK